MSICDTCSYQRQKNDQNSWNVQSRVRVCNSRAQRVKLNSTNICNVLIMPIYAYTMMYVCMNVCMYVSLVCTQLCTFNYMQGHWVVQFYALLAVALNSIHW